MDNQIKAAMQALLGVVLDVNAPDFPVYYQFSGGGSNLFIPPNGINGHKYIPNGEELFSTFGEIMEAKKQLLALAAEAEAKRIKPTFYRPMMRTDRGVTSPSMEEIGVTWREVYEYCITQIYNGVVYELTDILALTPHHIDDHRDNDLWIQVERKIREDA